MPALEPEEELILQHYVANGSKDQSAAWLAAHPNSKAKPNAINVMASRFFAKDKVKLRLAELHAQVVNELSATTKLTLEAHMEKLRELRDEARDKGQLSAAIQAEKLRGEASRFYVKQMETGEAGDFDRMSNEELRAIIYDQDGSETKH